MRIMRIARIIKSNSHVDYAARVLDALETPAPPASADYRFGQFVKANTGAGEIIGVIYNSQLLNPEYGNFGPRLSTPPPLNSIFSPDYLNEQGVLIGLLLLGSQRYGNAEASRRQGIPREVLPINAEIETMTTDEIRAFHLSPQGHLQLHYYAHVLTHAGLFAFQLLTAILEQLEQLSDDTERARLSVLRRSITWQQTMGRMMKP
jgi:hypothetical protein